MGDTTGYAIRATASTTSESAREAWGRRETIPTWVAIVGSIGLFVNFASGMGIALILFVFVCIVVAGGHKAGDTFRRFLRTFAYVFMVEVALGAVAVIVVVIVNHSSS